MSKHTPGPWIVHNQHGTPLVQVHGDECWYTIATCAGVNEANARLIAAAPELLAACKEVIAQWQDFDFRSDVDRAIGEDVRIAMQAAIAKAEGSTP